MKKENILKIIGIVIILIVLLLLGIKLYHSYQIKHAIKKVKLSTKTVEVYSDIHLKDLIKSINGTLLENPKINTKKLGKQQITFNYRNDDKIKISYQIEIEVVDTTKPIISLINSYSVTVGEERELEKELFCGDNYDSNPKCYIEGEYNLNEVGTYPLTFIGEDKSKNKTSHDFTLYVKEKKKTNNHSSGTVKTTDFEEIVEKYKTKKTKIGIDISHWQGDIDFKQVKASGVEFVYIRVGRGNGIGKEYVLDDKFKQNIEGFNKAGIPVGIYFYSYANSIKDAEKEAKWVLKQIKNYQVDLEIVFDWENWNSYQEFDLSFHQLTEVSNAFTKTVEKKGYKGMLYSSKNYLETIWYPVDYAVWLAHYTEQTNYEGKYKLWQICNNGKVSGIPDNLVDIDILYQ